ncbi:MAG: preprotein translocase subunit SecA [Candidatus Omnitrophica bacterium]|nr:preprotein translocase subunit SecA [Candidatus Omnitrophota bacterium]
MGILSKLFKTSNERELNTLWPIASQVNAKESFYQRLSDKELAAKTDEFRPQIKERYKSVSSGIVDLQARIATATSSEEKDKLRLRLKDLNNSVFSEHLADSFAVVREAARRAIGMRHFDVQILGGIVLHQGKIAEMVTGEGKTLVATLAAYLNALAGRGVHIVTVNDYLARRDRDWMGPVFEFLGLSVGVIQHDMSPQQRRIAYSCDITYGTNNEFGFDYLRDNMVIDKQDMVQRPFCFAILDEVDSILVDEARTPLIISGPAEESTEKYYQIDRIVPKLKGRIITQKDELDAKFKGTDLNEGFDYIVDEKLHTAALTEEGVAKSEKLLGVKNLYDDIAGMWVHHITCALKAHNLFKRDVHYVLKEGKVIIVDEFTGRLMPGRRWSDGLHQAVEAKEDVKIERENQTLATITFQNYFRMYEKLAGMTGTAMTEAQEFKHIYGLDVVSVPTNQPLIRESLPDAVFKSQEEKFNAVVEEITNLYNLGRPVLVGTISIERSEALSDMLKKCGVQHQVLNAKYHEFEAQIIAQAGRLKTITIATNMAGRGTDIILGGNPEYIAKAMTNEKNIEDREFFLKEYERLLEEFKKKTDAEHEKVVALGGLHVIGTERHEARRIDNQLRGRSGRQGDPGSSRFYVSFEDDLMRLFGSDRMINVMNTLGLEKGQAIEHPWVSKSIEVAQKRVENHNFEIRKQILEYDNAMNRQREVIYQQRRMVLEGESLREEYFSMIDANLESGLSLYLNSASPGEVDLGGCQNWLKTKFGLRLELDESKILSESQDSLREDLFKRVVKLYQEKENNLGQEMMCYLERMILLQIIDAKWKDHLLNMDALKEGIGLRAYGQRDPLIEYQREAFNMFQEMIEQIKQEAVEFILKVQAPTQQRVRGVFSSLPQELIHEQRSSLNADPAGVSPVKQDLTQAKPQPKITDKKVGRNDPCPCGAIDPATNKPIKYKKCHGK